MAVPVPPAWPAAVAALPVSVVVLGLVVIAGAVWGAVSGSKTDTAKEQLAASHGGSKAKKMRRSRRKSLRKKPG